MQAITALIQVESRHHRKEEEEGKRQSRFATQADGTATILQVIKGKEPKAKAKPLALSYGSITPEKTRFLAKGTILQVIGTIKELTKTQDILVMQRILEVPQNRAVNNQKSLPVFPQQKRTELIQEKKGFQLTDDEQIEGSISQDAQAVYQQLLGYHYAFDIEMACFIESFFHRRALHRRFDGVSSLIKASPLILMELYPYENKFSPRAVTEKTGRKQASSDLLLAKVGMYLQMQSQHGNALTRLGSLYGFLHDEAVQVFPKDTYRFFRKFLLDGYKNLPRYGFSRFTPFTPSRHFSRYEAQITTYYTEDDYANGKAKKNAHDIYQGMSFYLVNAFFAETTASRELAQRIGDEPFEDCLKDTISPSLTPQQGMAVRNALTSRTSVILGGAGTGKTHVIRELVRVAAKHGHKAVILAPSAKAALHAAEEATDGGERVEYQTIHRFCKILPTDADLGETGSTAGLSDEDSETYADYSFFIVDEMSMCSLPIFAKLLSFLSHIPKAHLVLVGDSKQLPAIGPQFFHQLADNLIPVLPRVALKKNFRAKSSELARFSSNLRQGGFTLPKNTETVELLPMSAEAFLKEHEAIAKDENTLFLTSRRDDAIRLNQSIRNLRMPRQTPIGSTGFCLGDKVITTQNDYVGFREGSISNRHPKRDMNIFNGTEGTIESYDKEKDAVLIRLFAPGLPAKGKPVPYHASELPFYFQPGYVLTVYKAQGSQADTVVLCVNQEHRLNRNLLYTAVTRARRKVFLLGTEEIYKEAVQRTAPKGRTFFAWRVLAELDRQQESQKPADPFQNLAFETL